MCTLSVTSINIFFVMVHAGMPYQHLFVSRKALALWLRTRS